MAQEILTHEILSRVVNIKYKNQQGSGFFIKKDSKNYLVTAKHIFGDSLSNKSKIIIQIFRYGRWIDLPGIFLKHANSKIDIALIKHEYPTSPNHFSIETKGYVLSQNTFFLGFPYGLKIKSLKNINNGYPMPIVKKATLSGEIEANGISVLLLDGHNNPGFSGGPVVCLDLSGKSKYKWKIIGVVSSYINQNNELITPSGLLNYNENSGIIMAMNSDYIHKIIDRK